MFWGHSLVLATVLGKKQKKNPLFFLQIVYHELWSLGIGSYVVLSINVRNNVYSHSEQPTFTERGGVWGRGDNVTNV